MQSSKSEFQNVQVHGSEKVILAKRRKVEKNLLSELERDQDMRRKRQPKRESPFKQLLLPGPGRVVLFAISMNGLDCIFKFGGAYLTNSKSLLAEGFHSMMDTVNQVRGLRHLL